MRIQNQGRFTVETTEGAVHIMAHDEFGAVVLYQGQGLVDTVEYAATWFDRDTARDMYRLLEVVWDGHVIASYRAR